MLPLLPLLLPCCSAQSRKAVVALRGDAFRFGHNSKQGCVHVNQSYANQLWQVESIKRYVMEPLRAAGYAVAVTGVVYAGCDAAWTRAIAAALAPASDATRIDFALPRRDEHQQRVVFALAVDHAFRLHPDAAFVVVSRLDVTYCRAMRRPNGTLWRASLGVGFGTGWWDQVHVVGAGARDAVRRVLSSPKSLHSAASRGTSSSASRRRRPRLRSSLCSTRRPTPTRTATDRARRGPATTSSRRRRAAWRTRRAARAATAAPASPPSAATASRPCRRTFPT